MMRRCAALSRGGSYARVQSRTPLPGRAATAIVATVLALIVVPVGLNRIWQTSARTDLPVLGALDASGLAVADRESLRAVRGDDDHPTRDRDRRFG